MFIYAGNHRRICEKRGGFKMMRAPVLVGILVFLMLSGGLSLASVRETGGQASPGRMLVINPGTLRLDMCPGENPVGQVNIQISNPTSHEEEHLITITGPGLVIMPSMVRVKLRGGGDIIIPLAVTPGPALSERFCDVTAVGEVIGQDGAPPVVPVKTYSSFQVTVTHHPKIHLVPTQSFLKMRPGEEKNVTVNISNQGSDRVMELDLFQKRGIEDEDYISRASYSNISLESMESKNVNFTITTPKRFQVSEAQVLVFESWSEEDNRTVQATIILLVSGSNLPTLELGASLVLVAIFVLELLNWMLTTKQTEEESLGGVGGG